jgi:hypothetical protein
MCSKRGTFIKDTKTMKKAHLFILLSLLFSLEGLSQKYYPMLDAVNNWRYVQNDYPAIAPPHQALLNTCNYPNSQANEIYTTTDTLIATHTYKKLMLLNPYPVPCLYGYIREDTAARKVYFMDNLSHPDVLLYDFSMQLADSTYLTFPYPNGLYHTGFYRLDSIKTIHIKAGNRRAFYLNTHQGTVVKTLEWIESLGNLIDNVYPYAQTHSSFGPFSGCPGLQHQCLQFLSCFDHNYKVYYDSCAWHTAITNGCLFVSDTCDYHNICGGIQEFQSLSSASLYPNPSSEELTLKLDLLKTEELELKVWDLNGRLALAPISLGKVSVGLQERKINISTLLPGMYFIELLNKEEHVYLKLMVN